MTESRRHLAVAMPAALLLALTMNLQAPARTPDNAEDYQLARTALADLLRTPLGRTLPQLPWKVEPVESWQVDAYSNGRGQIVLTTGLGYVLGDELGVWAAVLAHELGHAMTLYTDWQPRFEAELRNDYLAAGGREPHRPRRLGAARGAGQRRFSQPEGFAPHRI